MYTNSCCTLYLKSLNYKKCFVPNAFIARRSTSALAKLGLTYQESLFCMFEGNYDALKNLSLGSDFLVKGNCELELEGLSGQELTNALKTLVKECEAVTVMDASFFDYGRRKFHWELSCK